MSSRDKILMKLMTNKVVIKIISNRVVIKIMNVELRAFLWVSSLFSRKKK